MKFNRFQQLKVFYGIALTFIALTLLSSSLLMQQAVRRNEGDARAINLSGRQRMLSQRLTKCVLALGYSNGPEERTRRLHEIAQALSSWKAVHLGLQHGDQNLGLPPRQNSTAISALFAELDPFHTTMVQALEQMMVQVNDGGVSPEVVYATADVVLREEPHFLELMDKITFQFDKESKERVLKLESLERVSLYVGLVVLVLEFLFVFRPSISQIAKMMNLLKSIIDSPQGVVIFALDRSYCYTQYSRSHQTTMQQIYGIEIQIGMNILDAIKDPGDREKARRNFDRVLEGEHLLLVEEYGDPSLQRTFYENRYSPILDEAGAVLGVTVFVTDVSERKRAEEALRSSESKFRAIIDASPIPFGLNDDQQNITFLNQAFTTTFGYDANDIPTLAQWWESAYPDPEYRLWVAEEWSRRMDQTRENAAAFAPMEVKIRCKDGSERIAIVTAVSLGDQLSGVHLVVLYDITQRKKEEIISNRLATIVESSDDAIISQDLNGTITSWNRGAEKIFGYSAGELVGTSILRLIPPDRQAEEARILDKIQAGGFLEHFETIRIAKDGRPIDISLTASPIRDASGQIVGVSRVSRDITEHKRVEEMLRESEARYVELAEQSSTVAWEVDATGLYTYVSKISETVWGYSPEELVGRKYFYDLHPESGRTSFKKYALAFFARKQSFKNFSNTIQTKDGHKVWVSTNGVPLLNADGTLRGYRGGDTDITERKQAEAALSLAAERLSLATKAGGVGVWDYDLINNSLMWDDQMFALYGITRETFGGAYEAWAAGIHPDDLKRCEKEIQMSVQGEKDYQTEFRVLRPDGTIRDIRALAVVLRDDSGQAIRMIGTNWDITEHKQAEARLQLQSSALEAAANAIVITNSKGKIQWVNSAFTAFTGYTAEESFGKTLSLLKSGKHDKAFYKHLWDTVLAGKVWQGEITNRRKDGSLYPEEMTITPMKDHSGAITHFIVIKQDITERKAMEQKFLRAERMQSIGTLAAGVAHDLNNILAPIILATDVIMATEDAETRKSLLTSISECAQRGAAVVNQVLIFARGAKGERTALQLDRLIEEMEKIVRDTFPGNISITSSIPADIGPVNGDPTQIHQVLLNLCVNARDAMPEGGTIHITAENTEIDENFAAMVPDAKAGSFAVITVTDTGVGIPQEMVPKIFDPFFTTKEVGKGTGLGLSTLMGIVRSHGGFVTVRSEIGMGTTFKVFLPRKMPAALEQKQSPPPQAPHTGATILVVDDEAVIAKTLSVVFKNNGYNVFTAFNGNEALSLYREHAREIDLVLSDVIMPGMDGIALARELKEINPKVKIIASTGQATEIHQSQLRALGVDVILHKPYDAKVLLATLHTIFQREET